jgi:hypothetical protein
MSLRRVQGEDLTDILAHEWLASEFHRCRDWIQDALDYAEGEHEIEHVWAALKSGEAQLWPTSNGAVITTLRTYPTGEKAIVWWLAGGALAELKDTERAVSEWAKRQGCTRAVISGRRGWLKALDGYRETATVMVRTLRQAQGEASILRRGSG